MITLVEGYVSLKQFGNVFITEDLDGHIGYDLNLLCKKSSQAIHVLENWVVDIPAL